MEGLDKIWLTGCRFCEELKGHSTSVDLFEAAADVAECHTSAEEQASFRPSMQRGCLIFLAKRNQTLDPEFRRFELKNTTSPCYLPR